MAITVTDYPNVRERLRRLGCSEPNGFTILPLNFGSADSAEDLRQDAESVTVKKLLRSAHLPYDDILEDGRRPFYLLIRSYEWIAPTLFISAAIMSENPSLISVALSVVANYATDHFKGGSKKENIKIHVVIEKSRKSTCTRISYDGPPEELPKILDKIEAMKEER